MLKLSTIEVLNKHWIVGDPDVGPVGPYSSKAEAEEACRRLRKFFRYENEPGYVTSESYNDRKEINAGRV